MIKLCILGIRKGKSRRLSTVVLERRWDGLLPEAESGGSGAWTSCVDQTWCVVLNKLPWALAW